MLEQWFFLRDLGFLINFIMRSPFTAIGGELQRSYAEQQRKLDAGLSKAKPGESQHQHLRAIDLEFFKDGTWLKVPDNEEAQKEHKEILQRFGNYWESLSPKNRWGGNFTTIYDPNHFERVK